MFLAKIRLPKISLRLFNNSLSIVVALLAIYIITAPYFPQFAWWLKHDSPVKTIVHKPKDVSAVAASADNSNNLSKPKVTGDGLFIPRLEMEEAIHGGSMRSLRLGVWRLPHTSAPDKGGNTVVVGHRFTYDGPAVFYHLDKIQKGDDIIVRWKDKIYNYKVDEIKVVPPTEVSVEANTEDPRLTIYTCTPLLTAKNRLVVVAKPVEAQ